MCYLRKFHVILVRDLTSVTKLIVPHVILNYLYFLYEFHQTKLREQINVTNCYDMIVSLKYTSVKFRNIGQKTNLKNNKYNINCWLNIKKYKIFLHTT